MDPRELGLRIRRLRTLRGLSQRELADFAQKSERWLWSVEHADGRARLDLASAEGLALGLRVDVRVVLGLDPIPVPLSESGDRVRLGGALSALEIDPEDVPDPEDIEAAVLRLRRSYSTTAPDELRRRLEIRLRQIRRLLDGEDRSSSRRSLLAGAAWLALLRATVQADLSEFEAAETSVRVARELAREIGHTDVEAWTWETAAWIAATDGRQADARDLARKGIEVAPRGGHGLVAATMQRARINGALGDQPAAVSDLVAGQRALAAAGDVAWPDDHYSIDPSKAAFFASGTMTLLGRPRETIEHAAEVVRANARVEVGDGAGRSRRRGRGGCHGDPGPRSAMVPAGYRAADAHAAPQDARPRVAGRPGRTPGGARRPCDVRLPPRRGGAAGHDQLIVAAGRCCDRVPLLTSGHVSVSGGQAAQAKHSRVLRVGSGRGGRA
jgi:transcriptional regulator with XRE-family HTH domain